MSRTRVPVAILLTLTIVSSIIIVTQSNPVLAAEPAKLKIYVGPAKVPADNNVHECVFVQFQDSSSRPARALEASTVSLSSSLTSVGTVDPTITIAEGSTFAVARFNSTFTPGTTTIAAAASGYATVQAAVVTVAPVPSKLALYGFPPVLPTDGIPYEALVVQLQDSSSNPAKAPLGGVTVTLFSSDEAIVSLATSAKINGGQTHVLAAMTGVAPGVATITAMASGYTSVQTTVTTHTPLTNPPESLRIYSAPPKIMADYTERPQIVVQLLDNAGKITQRPLSSTSVQLSSSDENVGSIEPIVVVPAGKVFTTALFSATYRAGTTTITAAASNLQTDTETVTTIGPVPSKLAVYCNPSAVPADNQAYTTIQVQLQDSSGKPALDPNGEVTVSLFSSEPEVGKVPATLTIPYGCTYATASFTSTYLASTTSITAQASGYTTGQAQMKTYQIDQSAFNVTIIADPTNVVSGERTEITVYVTDPGQAPVAGATVKFNSSSTGTFTAVKAPENGRYTTVFTPPTVKTETDITITVTVSKTDYATSTASAQITVVLRQLSGILQICVKDIDNGEPITDATVSIMSKTSSTTNLTASTNSTGYAAFPQCTEGNYTLTVVKQGYFPMNTTFSFTTTAGPKTLYVASIDGSQSTSNQTMSWLILVAVIGAIAAAVATMLVLRRRRRAIPTQ
jgi:hypothetical protein